MHFAATTRDDTPCVRLGDSTAAAEAWVAGAGASRMELCSTAFIQACAIAHLYEVGSRAVMHVHVHVWVCLGFCCCPPARWPFGKPCLALCAALAAVARCRAWAGSWARPSPMLHDGRRRAGAQEL